MAEYAPRRRRCREKQWRFRQVWIAERRIADDGGCGDASRRTVLRLQISSLPCVLSSGLKSSCTPLKSQFYDAGETTRPRSEWGSRPMISTSAMTHNGRPRFANNIASEAVGIGGTSTDPRDFGPPNLSFASFSGLSDSNWSKTAVWNYGASDTLQLHRGKHNWSLGSGFTHYLNNTMGDSNGRGSFSFSGLATAQYLNGLPVTNTGNDFADFLLGLPETSSNSHGEDGVLSAYFRSNLYNAFAMDDWRVANNFTLNLGVRYEYFTPWHEEYGHMVNLDVAPRFAAIAPVIAGRRIVDGCDVSLDANQSGSSRLRSASGHCMEAQCPQQDCGPRRIRDLLHAQPVQQIRVESLSATAVRRIPITSPPAARICSRWRTAWWPCLPGKRSRIPTVWR